MSKRMHASARIPRSLHFFTFGRSRDDDFIKEDAKCIGQDKGASEEAPLISTRKRVALGHENSIDNVSDPVRLVNIRSGDGSRSTFGVGQSNGRFRHAGG